MASSHLSPVSRIRNSNDHEEGKADARDDCQYFNMFWLARPLR